MSRIASLLAGTCLSFAALSAHEVAAQTATDGKVVIGALVDMSGVYSRHGGPGVVNAVQMAVQDFGGTVNGKPITVLSSDYQNKVDVTSATARRWFDTEAVDMIIESTDSASALVRHSLCL